MTLDEAIKHAEEVMVENLEKTKDRNASDPIAINCFECADNHRQLAEWLKELKQLREQEPCEDAISRQAVLDVLRTMYDTHNVETEDGDEYIDYNGTVYEVENLPSAEKTGHWIEEDMFDGDVAYRCSECKELFCIIEGTPKDNEYNYCPNCGAKMESEE